ncbi:DUF6049 family protein [Nocardioides dongxiaopingii]|uniref:DUF6049 family protein n=1 Tax=Nocardioides sp. S-1144 TaxID=2582905 RepID=UPI0016522B3D|nr:DUF6049 family protein [Nocardioides sp. S-1144]
MVRPPTFSRALVVAAGLVAAGALGGLGVTPATAAPAAPAATPAATPAAPAGAVPAAAPDDVPAAGATPLAVRIKTLSPSTLPAEGPVRISGTVTNRTDEVWRSIDVYTFFGDGVGGAMRTQAQLDAAMDVPGDALLGDRILVGRPDVVDVLEPGEEASFAVTVPSDQLEVTKAGVYWLGIHALGYSASYPDDDKADGRARTFMPYVPRRFEETPLPAAVVVPITAPVRYEADGSLAAVESWRRWLAPEGRLSRLLGFVESGSTPVTWLVDPALVDAVDLLARGNPPRSIEPSAPDPADGATPTDAPSPTGEPSATAEPVSPEALMAAGWLARFRDAVAGDEVLTLPYGNVDVPAAVRHDRRLLDLALAQRSTVLADLGIESRPGVMSPSGYLDAESIAALDPETTVVVTDRMLDTLRTGADGSAAERRGTEAPAVASVEGRRLVAASYAVDQGSPGPGPSRTSVGLRQRFLAEAAVRLVKGEPRPLTVVLPQGWGLNDPLGFFSGLDVPWLDVGTVTELDEATVATPVDVAALDYPGIQAQRELDGAAFDDVAALIEAGDVLQNVLLENNEVGAVITEEALTGLSYAGRSSQPTTQLSLEQSLAWVADLLDGVEITTSPGVTLSGTSGPVVVTLDNTLDHAVEVRVRGESDSGIEITGPDRIELAADSRTTELLTARTTTNRVHNVELVVTDLAGNELGSSADVPVRSAQVSDVIWLIMGTGAGLLFLAIAVRVVRRVRAARRGEAPDLFATRAEQTEAARASGEQSEPAEVP